MENTKLDSIKKSGSTHGRLGQLTVEEAPKTASEEIISEELTRTPRSVFFIMGNEAVERFSFYGMKAILAMYLHHRLRYHQDNSTFIVHFFVFLCYTFPILGAVIADSYWGRYKTIINLSFIYCLGNAVMSIGAIPEVSGDQPPIVAVIVGLFLIAAGTGGIKPCVSAFVGDQFRPGQEVLLSSIFAAFYFIINIGSLASTFITPLLHEYVSYAVAFGLPACLLLISTFIFWIGRSTYRHILPGGENVIGTFMSVIGFSLAERRRCYQAKVKPLPHWLDYAMVVYPKDTVDDVKRVLKVLKVFLPLPMFWALYDQHASRWIFQADQMNLHIGSLRLLPDQIPALNPMLLLMSIPLFDRIIYPTLRRLGFPLRPLSRIASGMFFSALSFSCAGIVQIFIDHYGDGVVSVGWVLPQYVLMCCGEILVSITGLEFAYSQAPRRMKSVVMSCYLLTTAFGNLFIAIIAEIHFHARMYEFFFFAGIMLIFMFGFIYTTRHYPYATLRASATDILRRPARDAEDGSSSDSEMDPSAPLM